MENKIRKRRSLKGDWRFVINPADVGESINYPLRKPSLSMRFLRGFNKIMWRRIKVPGDWNTQIPELKWYDGIVWYAKGFDIPKLWKKRNIWLRIRF